MATPAIERPIIIVGAPRSGTTILRNCLALHPDLWHLPGEAHAVLEGPFHPSHSGYESNRVTSASSTVAGELRAGFANGAINLNEGCTDPVALLSAASVRDRIVAKIATARAGRRSQRARPDRIRLLEKTPKNTLRVPLMAQLFPDALWILLTRRPEPNIDSLVDGWNAVDRFGPFSRPRFAASGYPIAQQLELRDYDANVWKFALAPGWRELHGASVADVCAWQYLQCNRYAMADLDLLGPRVFRLAHEEFTAAPVEITRAIFEWAELPESQLVDQYAAALPRVNATSEAPRNQGLRNASVRSAIDARPEIRELATTMGY